MKKKNGFSAVAVVAAITITLVVILMAVPNLKKVYGESKKENFKNIIQNIADATLLQDSDDLSIKRTAGLFVSGIDFFEGKSTTSTKYTLYKGFSDLDLDININNSELRYVIAVNSEGIIEGIAVSDGNYCFAGKEPILPVEYKQFSIGNIKCIDSYCGCPNGDGFYLRYSFEEE